MSKSKKVMKRYGKCQICHETGDLYLPRRCHTCSVRYLHIKESEKELRRKEKQIAERAKIEKPMKGIEIYEDFDD